MPFPTSIFLEVRIDLLWIRFSLHIFFKRLIVSYYHFSFHKKVTSFSLTLKNFFSQKIIFNKKQMIKYCAPNFCFFAQKTILGCGNRRNYLFTSTTKNNVGRVFFSEWMWKPTNFQDKSPQISKTLQSMRIGTTNENDFTVLIMQVLSESTLLNLISW